MPVNVELHTVQAGLGGLGRVRRPAGARPAVAGIHDLAVSAVSHIDRRHRADVASGVADDVLDGGGDA